MEHHVLQSKMKRTFSEVCAMSALLPKTDMVQHDRDVRFVLQADILHRGRDWHFSTDLHNVDRELMRPGQLVTSGNHGAV